MYSPTERQARGDNRGQALGDGGYGERDGDFEVIDGAADEAPMRGVAEVPDV